MSHADRKGPPDMDPALQLYNETLFVGRIVVRLSVANQPASQEFRVELVSTEGMNYGGTRHTALVHLKYGAVIAPSGPSLIDRPQVTVTGPFEQLKVTAQDTFRDITRRWLTYDDPVVIGGRCLWLKPYDYVGCARPYADLRGVDGTFGPAHPSFGFPQLCLFAGQLRFIVSSFSHQDRLFSHDAVENFIKKFDGFFIRRVWYEAVGRPA